MPWSISLDRTWERCQRQYFFQYKMAWPTASDEQRKQAQFLKDLLSPEMWQGKLVHKAIEDYILPRAKSRNWPSDESVILPTIKLAKQQFVFSKNKTYQSIPKNAKREDYCVLTPHFFDSLDEHDLLDKTIDVVSHALRNLLSSDDMRNFLSGRPYYRIEKTSHFKVGDTTVNAIPDLVMTHKKRNGIDIIDWKVATASGRYDFQVAVYALAVEAIDWLYEQAANGIYGYVINLLEPDPAIALRDPYTITRGILDTTTDIIFEKNERIDALVKGRKFEQLNINDFRFAHSDGTCALCNWKSMCVEMSNGSPAKLLPDYQSNPTQSQLSLF